MKCPNCDFIDKDEAFGDPATCPKCGAIYEKALRVQQLKKKLEAQKAENAASKNTSVKKSLKGTGADTHESKEEKSIVDKWLSIVLLALGVAIFFSAVDSYREHSADPSLARDRARQAEEKLKDNEKQLTEERRKAEDKRRAEADDLRRIKIQRLARDGVKRKLYDPYSAKFINQQSVCGEVNSKNLFGAYTGYQRFIYGGDDLIFFENDPVLPAEEFEEIWYRICLKEELSGGAQSLADDSSEVGTQVPTAERQAELELEAAEVIAEQKPTPPDISELRVIAAPMKPDAGELILGFQPKLTVVRWSAKETNWRMAEITQTYSKSDVRKALALTDCQDFYGWIGALSQRELVSKMFPDKFEFIDYKQFKFQVKVRSYICD